MRLRAVRPDDDDVDAYVRMRCDPAMMAALGGPLPPDGMAEKVRRDAELTAAGADMTMMIILDETDETDGCTGTDTGKPDAVAREVIAGSVTLWPYDDGNHGGDDGGTHGGEGSGGGDGGSGGGHRSGAVSEWEAGWMLLPEFQGRGLAKRAVRCLLAGALARGHHGRVHALPGVTNAPSNGICRSLGFRLVEERDTVFAGRVLRVNHWTRDLGLVPSD